MCVEALSLLAEVDGVFHLAAALVRRRTGAGPVDRELQVVRTDAVALGVRVAEGPADEHLVVGEIETVDEDASAEGDLLVLVVVVCDAAVEHHAAHGEEREHVLGPDLRVVERVEVQIGVLVVGHDLDLKLPLRVVAAADGVHEVLGGMPESVAWIPLACSCVSARTPCLGWEWYFTSTVSPRAFTSL